MKLGSVMSTRSTKMRGNTTGQGPLRGLAVVAGTEKAARLRKVRRHDVVRDTERREQKRRHEPGAVLTRHAMEQRRQRRRLGEGTHDSHKGSATRANRRLVAVQQGPLGTDRVVPRVLIEQRDLVHDDPHPAQPRRILRALLGAAQIDDAAQWQTRQLRDTLSVQPVQRIAPEQQPAARPP